MRRDEMSMISDFSSISSHLMQRKAHRNDTDVFSDVQAVLSPHCHQHLTNLEHVLSVVEEKAEVEIKFTKRRYVLIGGFEQIQQAREILEEALRNPSMGLLDLDEHQMALDYGYREEVKSLASPGGTSSGNTSGIVQNRGLANGSDRTSQCSTPNASEDLTARTESLAPNGTSKSGSPAAINSDDHKSKGIQLKQSIAYENMETSFSGQHQHDQAPAPSRAKRSADETTGRTGSLITLSDAPGEEVGKVEPTMSDFVMTSTEAGNKTKDQSPVDIPVYLQNSNFDAVLQPTVVGKPRQPSMTPKKQQEGQEFNDVNYMKGFVLGQEDPAKMEQPKGARKKIPTDSRQNCKQVSEYELDYDEISMPGSKMSRVSNRVEDVLPPNKLSRGLQLSDDDPASDFDEETFGETILVDWLPWQYMQQEYRQHIADLKRTYNIKIRTRLHASTSCVTAFLYPCDKTRLDLSEMLAARENFSEIYQQVLIDCAEEICQVPQPVPRPALEVGIGTTLEKYPRVMIRETPENSKKFVFVGPHHMVKNARHNFMLAVGMNFGGGGGARTRQRPATRGKRPTRMEKVQQALDEAGARGAVKTNRHLQCAEARTIQQQRELLLDTGEENYIPKKKKVPTATLR